MKPITMVRKKLKFFTFLIICFWVIQGCIPPTSTQEKDHCLKTLFQALRLADIKSFQLNSITTAEIDLSTQKVGVFKKKLSYLGSSLLPEQRKQLLEKFEKARSYRRGQIDFLKARYEGIGKMLSRGEYELPNGGKIAYEIFSIKIYLEGKKIQTDHLSPYFAIVQVAGRFKLADLIFREDPEEFPEKPEVKKSPKN